ncbi:MAG TPA: hypothetical protein VGK17_23045 [Propionicimonas sp.]|jgi:hypothetical protein
MRPWRPRARSRSCAWTGPRSRRSPTPSGLYYWRSADGREIDFLVTAPELAAAESKYAVRRTGKDYQSITKAFGRGTMVSRRDVELGREVVTVPAGVLLGTAWMKEFSAMPRTWLAIRVELIQGCGDALGNGREGRETTEFQPSPRRRRARRWPAGHPVPTFSMATDDRPGGRPSSPLTVTSRDPA